MSENYNATAATYGIPDFGLLYREKLRIRIERGHEPFAESEPVRISAGSLPAYETEMPKNIMYEGDGRIPDDILGGGD